jgi:large subunit ribosomal protein L3
MTHAFIVDYRKRSTTAAQEVAVPVTVIETPPIHVVGARLYREDPYGSRVVGEVWAAETHDEMGRAIPSHPASDPAKVEGFRTAPADEIRLIVHTEPWKINGIGSKTPDIFEVRISGEAFEDRRNFALAQLGKEVTIDEVAKEGEFWDLIGVTKGKGFQGHIQRWGVHLQPHKNSKHRRMIGTLGPHNPSFVTFRIPQAGQMGYHKRTVYNIRLLKIVRDPATENVTPKGGYLHYGPVRSSCVIVHGTVPGPSKRLLRFRLPIRSRISSVEKVDVRFLSTTSKQGV